MKSKLTPSEKSMLRAMKDARKHIDRATTVRVSDVYGKLIQAYHRLNHEIDRVERIAR